MTTTKRSTKQDTNHPIALAVEPLRAGAITDAKSRTWARIGAAWERIEAAGGDLTAAGFGYPKSGFGRAAYMTQKELHEFASMITRPTRGQVTYRMDEVIPVAACGEAADRMIERAGEAASADFDAYVAKLIHKAGAGVVAANMVCESGLWSWSILDVTMADGSVVRWKTQRIVNTSVHGRLFNQYPTRRY
ncbi:MAG: hypothetical protein ACOYBR_09670 [Fluviibacter sp.]